MSDIIPLVVLVCGGRDFVDRAHVFEVLDAFGDIGTIVHGAARGADSLAEAWAVARSIPSEPFEALWSLYGKSAGARRNTAMAGRLRYLDSIGAYRPLVLAFPGGRGTANMIAQARGKQLPVRACCEAHPLPPVKQ